MSLSLVELDKLIDSVLAAAQATQEDYIFYVSPQTKKRVLHLWRIGCLFKAYPLPHRKLRKCQMRKLQLARKRGKAHIQRVEQCETEREAKLMQQARSEI